MEATSQKSYGVSSGAFFYYGKVSSDYRFSRSVLWDEAASAKNTDSLNQTHGLKLFKVKASGLVGFCKAPPGTKFNAIKSNKSKID